MKGLERQVLVGALLLASAHAGLAQNIPPSCNTSNYTIQLAAGPTPGETCFNTNSTPPTRCTTVVYDVSRGRTPSNVSGLVPGIIVAPSTRLPLAAVTQCSSATDTSCLNGGGIQIFPPGAGDPNTKLGQGDVSRQGFSVNPNGAVVRFKIWLYDQSSPQGYKVGVVPIVIRTGGSTETCALAGPVQANGDVLTTQASSVTQSPSGNPSCSITATTDASGNTNVVFTNPTAAAAANCKLTKVPLNQATISIGGLPAGQLLKGAQFWQKGSTCYWDQYFPPSGDWWQICY